MAIMVRRADIDSDRNVLINTLTRYLDLADQRRYDWLYEASPFGRAHAWLAVDSSGEAIGAAAVFPRPMLLSGQAFMGCVLGDFCISEQHRSLGPALQLLRECLAGTRTGEYAFAYDFPSKPMMAVYSRLGLKPTRSLLHLTKPLHTNPGVFGCRRDSWMGHIIGRVGDSVLRHLEKQPTSAFVFTQHNERFGEEFTLLANEIGQAYTLCTFRSATYLNWRYKDHPSRQYRVVTARTRKGKLVGYAVFNCGPEDATIVDLIGERNPQLLQGLVLTVAAHLRSEGTTTLYFPLIEDSAWVSTMRRIGFIARRGSPVIMYAGQGNTHSVPDKVLLLAGDRES